MSPRSLGSSALLHVLIILLVVFGLPNLFVPDEPLMQPQVIALDLKIAPINNAPNRTPKPPKKQDKPAPKVEREKAKQPDKPKEQKKPDPKPKKPEKTQKPKEANKPKEVKTPKQPDKPEKVEKPKKQPDKPKEEEELSLEELLEKMEKESAEEDTKPAEKPVEKGQKSETDVPYDPKLPLSQTVENAIRNQIMACWNYQGGAKDQEMLVARIQVIFREDGSVIEARLKATDQMRYNTSSEFRSLVDSARRATRNPKCVPLKGLPIDQYRAWSKIELVFDPKEM